VCVFACVRECVFERVCVCLNEIRSKASWWLDSLCVCLNAQLDSLCVCLNAIMSKASGWLSHTRKCVGEIVSVWLNECMVK